MEVYRMLLTNRIREYIRLFKNMYIQIIGLLILLLIMIYSIGSWLEPIIVNMGAVNFRIFYTMTAILFLVNMRKSFGRIKPSIVVKPMTLFLFDENRLKKIFALKYTYYFAKYIVISLVLSICTYGLNFDFLFLVVFLVYFLFLYSGLLISWNLYNTTGKHYIKNILRSIVIILGVVGIGGIKYYMLIVFGYILLLGIYFYTVKKMELNYYNYGEDMTYMERVLVAQNNNNIVLLSQYAKEKIAMSAPKTVKSSSMLLKYPLIWKAFISINRTGKNGLIIGAVSFILTFMVYTIPFFWQFPVIEMEQIRYVLLLFGIFMFYQLSIQTFIRQLIDILEKQKEGLYIPIKVNIIIRQFSVVPEIILLTITILLGFLLKSQLVFSLIFFLILTFYLFITLYMTVYNKRLFDKIYTVLSILILIISNLLLF